MGDGEMIGNEPPYMEVAYVISKVEPFYNPAVTHDLMTRWVVKAPYLPEEGLGEEYPTYEAAEEALKFLIARDTSSRYQINKIFKSPVINGKMAKVPDEILYAEWYHILQREIYRIAQDVYSGTDVWIDCGSQVDVCRAMLCRMENDLKSMKKKRR